MQIYSADNRPAVTIRPAMLHDAEAIGDLWIELMSFHATLDARFSVPSKGRGQYVRHVRNALRDENYRVLVAEADRRLVGFVLGYIGQNPPIFPQERYGFIADLCVTRDCRRRRVGERLVKMLCAWFRERGLRNVQLNVACANPLSQSFWRKMGCTDYLDHMWLNLE